MIKYYSTLRDRFYETEREAQTAEDRYIEEHFQKLRTITEAKKRKLKQYPNNTEPRRNSRILII